MTFDVEAYHAYLQSVAVPPQPPVRMSGYLRPWTWPLTRAYNGYTSEERVRGWQMCRMMEQTGVLAAADQCSVCGKREGVQRHSEDYYSVFTAQQVCKGCHFAVHGRTKNPHIWSAFKAKMLRLHHAPGSTPWFAWLPPEDIDLAGFVRDKYGDGVRDLLASPLYRIAVMPKVNGEWLPLGSPVPEPLEEEPVLRRHRPRIVVQRGGITTVANTGLHPVAKQSVRDGG